MTTIALEADEALFPFAEEYPAWRTRTGLISFDSAALTTYDFAALSGFQAADNEEATAFLSDHFTMDLPPFQGTPRRLPSSLRVTAS